MYLSLSLSPFLSLCIYIYIYHIRCKLLNMCLALNAFSHLTWATACDMRPRSKQGTPSTTRPFGGGSNRDIACSCPGLWQFVMRIICHHCASAHRDADKVPIEAGWFAA